MTNGATSDITALYQSWIDSKNEYISKLLLLKDAGHIVGSPTFDDIIQRELGSIDQLQKAIENAKVMRSRIENHR